MNTSFSSPQGVSQPQYDEFNFIFQTIHEAIEKLVPGSIHKLLQHDGPAFARTVARRSESGVMTGRLFTPVRKKYIPTTGEVNPIALQTHNREFLGEKIQKKISEQFPDFDRALQSKICDTYVDVISSFMETSRDMSLNQNLVSGYIYPKDALNLAIFTGILTGTIEMRKIPQEIAIQASREFMNDFHSQQYHENDAQKNALTALVKHLSRFHTGDILKTCREYSLTHAETDRVCASHNRRMLGAQADTTSDTIDNPLDAPLIRAGAYAAETVGIALRQGIDLLNETCLQNPRKPIQKQSKKQIIHTNKENQTSEKNIGSIACERVGEVVSEEIRNLGNKIRALMDQNLKGIKKMRAKTSQLLDPHPEEDVQGLRNQIGRLLRK